MNAKHFLPLALLILLLAGCGPDKIIVDTKLDPTQDRALAVVRAYSQFIDEKGKPPASEADLRPFLEKAGKADELLTSSRDGEKFVIVWGIDLREPQAWAKGYGVIGHEAKGNGQTRFVMTTMRNAPEMTNEEFQAANFPPGHETPK